MVADVAQSDKLGDLADAAKKGDVKGVVSVVGETEEFKAVADAAKDAVVGEVVDGVVDELGENEHFQELPEGV